MLLLLLTLLQIICQGWAYSSHMSRLAICKSSGLALNMASSIPTTEFVTYYEELAVETLRGLSLVDITEGVREIVKKTECKEGVVTVLSKHSTVSVLINEMEGRLVDDTRQFLLNRAPPSYPHLHNDLDFRHAESIITFNSSNILIFRWR